MNQYDDQYEIRLATSADIDMIIQFIDQHWHKEHIMAKDRQLFEYEFVDGDSVNFMLAIDKKQHTLEAMAGFLLCSHTQDISKKDVWGSFWKVNTSHKNMTFLGVEIMKRLMEQLQCRCHLGIGINPSTTIPIRKFVFHEKTAKLKHYYFLNSAFENDYKIAIIKKYKYKQIQSAIPRTRYTKFHNIDEIRSCFDINRLDAIPKKDFWYINKRFFQHPYYSYLVYGLQTREHKTEALIIMREVEQFGRKALRIVDYIGEQSLFAGTYKLWTLFMKESQYEYIDFCTFGFHEEFILSAGFFLRDESDENIIPGYFEPFVQENIDIWVRYSLDGTLFFKADGDQDRPNRMRS